MTPQEDSKGGGVQGMPLRTLPKSALFSSVVSQADCARSLGPVDGEAYGRPVRSADDMVLVGLVVGKPDRPCVDLS